MGYDEKIFNWLWNQKKKLSSSRSPRLSSSAVSLKENHHRFSLVSFSLAGEWLELFQAEESGGFIGNRFYLPKHMDFAEEQSQNEAAFIFRIAYSTALREMGWIVPETLASSAQRRLLDYVAIPFGEEKIREEFPALAQRIPTLKQAILKGRKPVDRLTQASDFFEALNQYFLGRALNPKVVASQGALEAYKWATQTASPLLGATHVKKYFQELKPITEALSFPLDKEGILSLWGRVPLTGEKSQMRGAKPLPSTNDLLPQGTEREKSPTEGAKIVHFDEDEQEQMPVQMIIEQVKTLDRFMGGKKTMDASDELEMHGEALDEINIREVYRSKKQAQSIFRSDVSLSPADVEVEDLQTLPLKTFFYDEWNFNKKSYRKNWCQIVESQLKNLKPISETQEQAHAIQKKYRKEIRQMEQWFRNLSSKRNWKNRQADGVDIDLDQMVDRYACVRSGHSPSEKLYLSKRRREVDLSLLVLLDSSLSTGSWIDGRQIMATSKETLMILNPVFSDLIDQVALAGFYSHTRTRCTFIPIKDFKEKWDVKTQQRLMSLDPAGYTRIGPALRHSIEKMKHQSASKKAILLITDGKPSDYDAYEGRYGIEDVRQTIREAHGRSIGVFSLAIDQRARTYFPQMFGQNHFSILRHPKELPFKLMKWYTRLLYSS